MPVTLEPELLPPREYRADGGAPPDGGDDAGGGGGGGGGEGDDSHGRDPGRGWVTLATFWHPAQAHIARLRLESAGVMCVLLGEFTAATHVLVIATGGVKLQVPRAQFDRAARLLGRPPQSGRPEPRVALADFERILHAKSAACVIEAAGLWCDVIERRTAELPRWGRWLPGTWRARLWPAASVIVERDELIAAARALAETPFASGLTQAARSAPHQHCGACAAGADWAIWQLRWAAEPKLANRPRLPRLVRRCGRCGVDWGASGS